MIELLVAIALTALILTTLSFAVSEGFRNTTTTKNSIDRSILGNFVARYFSADVASAVFGEDPAAGTPAIKTSTTTPAARSCHSGLPSSIDIQTSATTAVTYTVVTGTDGSKSLIRSVCSGTPTGPLSETQSFHLGTTDNTFQGVTPDPSCSAAGSTSCAMALSWNNPGYSITVSGTRWVNATTTTT
jgi:hypothetical protein